MRRLNKSVVTGGVVYPAGTAATPELEVAILNPALWDGPAEFETTESAVRLAKQARVEKLQQKAMNALTLSEIDEVRRLLDELDDDGYDPETLGGADEDTEPEPATPEPADVPIETPDPAHGAPVELAPVEATPVAEDVEPPKPRRTRKTAGTKES